MAAGASISGEEWRMCFLGSLSINSFVVSFSLISSLGSLDLPLVIGSCFLVTNNLIWPTRKEHGSFQGVRQSVADNETCAAFLGTVWAPAEKSAVFANADLCTATVAALVTLLLWYDFSLMPQWNRAELRASLAARLLFSQGMWGMLRSI